jgi:hypothetical protein
LEARVSEDRVDRRLAAILAGDIAGYSRLMSVAASGTRLPRDFGPEAGIRPTRQGGIGAPNSVSDYRDAEAMGHRM